MLVAAVIVVACVALPAIAQAAFPGTPTVNPRLDTPNDPDFDYCELDDPSAPPDELDEPPTTPLCTTYTEEDFRLFGFGPDSAVVGPDIRTPYWDCAQLDTAGQLANASQLDPPCAQIAGIRADAAWKYSTGDPGTSIAILDTGIRWQDRELVNKVRLNSDELPVPQDGGVDCASDDCNGDGAFDIRDFADDGRVAQTDGDSESDSILDASDLIARFSDDNDNGDNGYVDDIAGWDFFDDDNDPFDASSCCSANGHGTGRAREAAAETDNRMGSPGVCPDCQILPLRVWDTFVVPGDNFAMGVVYATDNGASVVEGAVGGLTNTAFGRSAFSYADEHGVALTLVSSDINSANHNYPTNYNEADLRGRLAL